MIVRIERESDIRNYLKLQKIHFQNIFFFANTIRTMTQNQSTIQTFTLKSMTLQLNEHFLINNFLIISNDLIQRILALSSHMQNIALIEIRDFLESQITRVENFLVDWFIDIM